MKCPETPSKVKLMKDGRGVYERYIGRWENGNPRRWRFGTDEARAKVEAWETWQKWENRQENCASWEDLDKQEKYRQICAQYQAGGLSLKKAWEENAEANTKKAEAARKGQTEPQVGKVGWTIAEAKTLYLESLERRIGLTGSLGIVAHTHQQTTHKVNRALAFIPSTVSHLAELGYRELESLIYTIAARPSMLPNPLADKEIQKAQKKKQVSQRTALGWIQEIKSFLLWCYEDERIGYILPRRARELWKIRPEAEEQVIRTITSDELTELWHGCVNEKAHDEDKGKRRRLFLMLGLNCGFYGVDVATLLPDHITDDGFIWKLRRKTRKTNSKLARTKWKLWKETAELLDEYMPLKVTTNQIRLAWRRLCKSAKVKVAHSNLRDTGALFMERIGGTELADTYLAHSRKGVIDSYSHPDWDTLSAALDRFYAEFVSPAISKSMEQLRKEQEAKAKAEKLKVKGRKAA